MAANVFCLIDGVKGESGDKDFKEQIEVLSYSGGIHQPVSATASSSGGGTTERAEHRDITFEKELDKTSPELAKLCNEGKHIKSVVFSFNRAGGDGKRVLYYKVELENVVISNININASSGVPKEEVSLNFGKIRWTYDQQQRSGGGSGGKVVAGWDLETWAPW